MGKPTGFIEYGRVNDFTLPPGERVGGYNGLHTPLPEEERRLQAARCMDCGVPFCQSGFTVKGRTYGCPLHNLIPEWNDSLYEGNWDAALIRLLKTNSFPEFTGRVCPGLCETACTCGMDAEPVAIRENEMSIIERAFERGKMLPRPPGQRSGKRVAVVGSGPAGMAAAYRLNRRGHSVTVFEKENSPGGLMMYGIPEMKLPKAVITRRVRLMEDEGVVFRTGCEVGRDIEADEISSEFDCVILCCGASRPREMSFEGNCSSGVVYAADYLKSSIKARMGEARKGPDAQGKRVVIVGAGDTATDCVATAVRQGCSDVIQLVRRPRSDYESIDSLFPTRRGPCYKVEYGQEEAIAVFGRDPRRHETVVRGILTDEDGVLTGIKISRPDSAGEGGKRTYENEEKLEADMLLLATGFSGCDTGILTAFGGETDEKGNAKTNGLSLGGKVFAAGDMRRGQSLVVWAIAEGRQAAREADRFLMGYTNV